MSSLASIASMAPIAAMARAVLPRYFGSAGRPLTDLTPEPAHFDQLVRSEDAARVRDGYARLGPDLVASVCAPSDAWTHVVVASTEDLADPECARARAFTGGLRQHAWRLQPGVVWAALRLLSPGARSGTVFDGFAHVGGDRFVWLPKLHRILAARPLPRPFTED